MAITLDALSLPDDLIWTDEHDWQSIRQSLTRSLGGRLFIQSGSVINGRPITLTGDQDAAWISRATLDSLYALADQNLTMTLTLNSAESYQVLFRYQEQAIQASPVIDYNTPASEDFYTLVLKMVVV